MENLMEMEHVINGEKYLVTVSKVEEANIEKELNCGECPCRDVCDAGKESPSNEGIETIKFGEDDVTIVPLSMVPDYMTIEQWLAIIKEYGIILID